MVVALSSCTSRAGATNNSPKTKTHKMVKRVTVLSTGEPVLCVSDPFLMERHRQLATGRGSCKRENRKHHKTETREKTAVEESECFHD